MPDLLFPMGVSTDMVSSSCSVVVVALEDLSLRVCVLFFRNICVFWVLSTLFFFRSGESWFGLRGEILRGGGVLFRGDFVIVSINCDSRRLQYLRF